MIYIVTLNPSIDYLMSPKTLSLGITNRSEEEQIRIGGKGINVGVVLNNLGQSSTCVGFLGGFTGNHIREELKKYPLLVDGFRDSKHPTRINIKLDYKGETEINGSGYPIDASLIEALSTFITTLKPEDFVVLTGSVASGMSYDWYVSVCEALDKQNIPFAVDVSSDKLIDMISYHPLLIKPNQDEICAILGLQNENLSFERLLSESKKLIERGARNIIVSLGSQGSMLITDEACYRAYAPEGVLIDSVGAGDSMVAAFIYGYVNDYSLVDAYRLACAAGSATAFSDHLASFETIEKLKDKIIIERIDL
ncbi:1-phosphofructokinase family hexose kinase [Erysipelothrix rhusiopathiae]|uniref:1-phosphofructokinase family hexose kinase n=1 Tax=Erysipelothrix rhusiopathiae TaxID=1648 RepID=UPI000210B398|nr:1-phosphofructokinase family hexose kinase [Erysipelothrix rhusiopathiae]AMS10272.1 fructose-1-phosphate kinase [Erysipelothrix rhusiopathiae]AOO67386.1 fructose-1-phosphate kinase [Erysipelothrix rhusiopathiae]AWU40691.1 1-phosphofructokinase family hexose kinase [Erysipelothrix rhusiopathiae]MCG4436446.1 1-phosphofructokinase family hexose kinase [Erysipelothrix rhusiopathiae]MCG4457463.1 1-phosphofructokinase family hexose kinase [Erysipelothrix rhusiopathiae]